MRRLKNIPDWIIHLGIAYLFARIFKIKEYRFLLFGSILPDLSWIGTEIFGKLFKIDSTVSYLYFSPFHTLFIMLLFSGMIAFITEDPKKIFGLIFGGSIIHLVLDILQKGSVVFLFYPLNLSVTSFGLFWEDDLVGYLLMLLSLIALIHAIFSQDKLPRIKLHFKKEAIALFFIILLIPYFTENLISDNLIYSQFSKNPDSYDGKKISIGNRDITSINPVTIDIMGKNFEIVTNEKLKQGDLISIDGYYTNQKIYATSLHKQNALLKPIASILGGIIFLIILYRHNSNKISEGVTY